MKIVFNHKNCLRRYINYLDAFQVMGYGLEKDAMVMMKITEDNLNPQRWNMAHIAVLYQKTTTNVILITCALKRRALFIISRRNAKNEVCGFALEKSFKEERAVKMIAKVLGIGHQLLEMVSINDFMLRISDKAQDKKSIKSISRIFIVFFLL